MSIQPSLSDDLVSIKDYDIICDLMYARDDNFIGKKIYARSDTCFFHKDGVDKLKKAIEIASILGYKIKIADAFRPIEVQKIFWNAFPDENFVSNPNNIDRKLGHCRGASLDLTLVNISDGSEVNMGTTIDYFGEKAFIDNTQITKQELQNRMILFGIMVASGFETISTEWWHFNLPDMERKYMIVQNGIDYVPIIK